MLVTFNTIYRVTFPVYMIPTNDWERVDSLVYIEGVPVDDRSIDSPSLGIRRLRSPHRKNFLPLKRSVANHIGIIKSNHKFFIDSKGYCFAYEKRRLSSVKYYRIKKVEQKKKASIVKLVGLRETFTVARPPGPEAKWAGIIYISSFPWDIYEFSEEKQSDIRRKI